MKKAHQQQGSAMLLRIAVLIIGLTVLAACMFLLPAGIAHDSTGGYRPVLVGLYATAIPFFVAVYQVLKLLGYIGKNNAFSAASVKALRIIKYCALLIGGMYAVGMPYIYTVADNDDAPGVLLVALIITFASLTIAVLAAVLQQLLQSAMAIKSENDLTV